MAVGYLIFKSFGSPHGLFVFPASYNEGMSVLTNRPIDNGIRSICHMVLAHLLVEQ